MKDLIHKALNGDYLAILNLQTEGRKNLHQLKRNIETLTDQELSKLGQIYKSFPFGCDLNEILVDVISSKQSITEIKGGFRLVDRLGFPLHVCSYAVADLAEKLGKTPFSLMKELRELTDMPIDVDHFGKYGPMRYPEEIVKCPADCYRTGKPFNGCPRGRIHKRLIEKEKANEKEMEKWFSVCQSVSVSFMSFQKTTSHAAPPGETLYVIEKAKSFGKGIGAIICVGNGKDELIKGLKACIDYEIDEIVIEGGPYNCAADRVRAFGEAVVMARIVSKGKIVATNGQYEDELKFGLKCGLNSVISGFPGNHHAYMSGYMPHEATVEKFGLPKVLEIMAEEIENSPFPVPADRTVSEVIAKSAGFLGRENIYPFKRIGGISVGDAHWFLLLNSPLGKKNKPKMTVEKLVNLIKEKKIRKLGIIGGRFISWVIVEKLAETVDIIHISDKNQDIEKFTVEHLKKLFPLKIERCYGDDKLCVNRSQLTVLASFIPSLIKKFRKIEGVLTLED